MTFISKSVNRTSPIAAWLVIYLAGWEILISAWVVTSSPIEIYLCVSPFPLCFDDFL